VISYHNSAFKHTYAMVDNAYVYVMLKTFI